ncbi:MAG: ABC transporter substrate-binding protein [Planctomycetota bacterium]
MDFARCGCFVWCVVVGSALSGCDANRVATSAPPISGAPPHRIVSLAPNLTEILLYLGAGERLVGVTRHCEEAPATIARVGDLLQPDFERMVTLKPDLVIGIASQQQHELFAALRRRGIQVELFGGESVAELRTAVRELGTRVAAEARATEYLARLDQALAPRRAASTAATRPPSVLFVVNRDPLWVAGGASFVTELLRAAGAESVYQDAARPWLQVDLEDVVARDPDFIVDTTLGSIATSPAGPAGAAQQTWARFATHLRAVRDGRVYAFPPVRAGIHVPEWVADLAALLERR